MTTLWAQGGIMFKINLFMVGLAAFLAHSAIYANERPTSENKTTPDINIEVMGNDLIHRFDVYGDYFLKSENTLMMYSAAKTTSDKPIKKIEWTYDGVTWEGWTFFPYLSESKGDTITVKVTNDDDEFLTQNLEIEYSDFCETQTRDNDFGFCLKSNNFSDNGDYIPLNIPFLTFYLSHAETLNGNLSNRQVFLVAESTGEAIDITAATSLSGSNLVVNMITLGASLELDDPTDKFYIALYGDYDNVTATFDYENTNARSKGFKLGLSGLNLAFGETANQLSVYSTSVPYGQVLSSSVGTSSVSLPYLPPGEYIIYVENATKEGYAQVYVNPEELVTVTFNMQPKNLSAIGRQPLSDSYSVFRSVFLQSTLKINSKPKAEKLKLRLAELHQKYEVEYRKVKGNYKDDPSPIAGIVYWNGFTQSSIDYPTQYTEDMFVNNYEMLKSQFLDPLPIPLSANAVTTPRISGQRKTFVSEYPAFPDPLLSVYNMQVQGTVPNGYATLPNKNEDFGTSSAGVSVQAGKNYAPFMFGDLPILHISKSKETIALMYEKCIDDANNDPILTNFCNFENNIAQEAWKVFLNYFSEEATVRVRYTVTGMYDSQERKIVHDHTYDFGTFVKENGDLYMASSKYIYSPEGTDINDGWLLGKQPYIYVPDYLTDAKIRLEMFTTIPSDIFSGLETFNLKAYIAGGLVEDERELPSVTNIMADASAVDILPNELPIIIPFKQNKKKLDAGGNGKLLFGTYGMLPITAETTPDGFYTGNDHSFEVILKTGPLNQFAVTGVSVSVKQGQDHYPDLGEHENGGYLYTNITWPYLGNQNLVKLQVDPQHIFDNDFILDTTNDVALTLRFQLIVDDTATPEVEELFGPIGRTATVVPSYNMISKNTMGIPLATPLQLYSYPNAVFGKKPLARFFKTIVESEINIITPPSTESAFKYNDASMPYGGKMSAHQKSHMDGRHLDIRYPHHLNNTWDVSVNPRLYDQFRNDLGPNSEFNRQLCSSGNGVMPEESKKLHHGYKKYLAIKNYLWIKRLVSQIHHDHKLLYPDTSMQSRDPQTEDHDGILVNYVAFMICDAEPLLAMNPALEGLCNDLKIVYNNQNVADIDDLITYIGEARENIEKIDTLTHGKKISVSQMLLSDGAGIRSCFPLSNNSFGFTYDSNWHEKLFQNGLFPDGVATTLGEWTKRPTSVQYSKGDFEHLSHIHVQVD